MPFPAATQHADGTAMDWTVIAGNVSGYRGYVNNVPAGDVQADAVQREHLVRPVIQGFPSYSIESSFQGAWWRTYGTEEPTALSNAEWGARRRRLSWFPDHLAAGEVWTFPVGATIYLPRTSWVEVDLWCEVKARHDPAVLTPNGAALAGSTEAGYLRLASRARSGGLLTAYGESRHDVYPIAGGAGTPGPPFGAASGFVAQLSAGTHDIVLQYVKVTPAGGVGAFGLYQFDLGRVNMQIEAH